jgi:ketosteroid isomerase-like protein
MRKLIPGILLAAALAPPAHAGDARAVEAALHAICAAFEAGDVAALERLLDPRFTLVASDAVQTSREDEIASVRDGIADYDVFENRDMVVRFYGDDLALVNGVTVVQGRWGGQPFARALRFTDTLLRRDGRWVLLASHATPLPGGFPSASAAAPTDADEPHAAH